MGDDSGDELQIIHPFHLFSSFPILVADLTFSKRLSYSARNLSKQ
jgi:hypothetical protein